MYYSQIVHSSRCRCGEKLRTADYAHVRPARFVKLFVDLATFEVQQWQPFWKGLYPVERQAFVHIVSENVN